MVYIGELIAEDVAGFACSKAKLASDGLLHLRPFNISPTGQLDLSDRYLVPYDEAPKNKRRLEAGDILFNNTNSVEWVGKSALIREPTDAGFSNHMTRVRVDRSKVLPEWFAYWLSRQQAVGFFAANATQWVSQAAYRLDDLKRLKITLPSVSEQRRVVDILDHASSIRRLRKAADDKLHELVPALFVDIFGDPVSNSRHWDVRPFGEAGRVQLGRQRAPKYQSGVFTRPYLRVANVFENRIDINDVLSMDFDESDFRAYRLEKNDILLNEGQSIDLVGRPAMWRGEIEDCCFQNTLVRFQPLNSVMLPEFAFWLIMLYYKYGVLRSISSKTSNVAHLGAGRFSKLNAILPPIELQRRFAQLSTALHSVRKLADDAMIVSEAAWASVGSEVLDLMHVDG